jgi:transcriptional regulator with XRE-family HTH domain
VEERELRGILGSNIKRCRLKSNLSQLALAEKLDISTNFLSDIERCKAWISPNTLVKLASVLDVEPYELFKADSFLSEMEQDILRHYADENLKAVLSVVNRLREH